MHVHRSSVRTKQGTRIFLNQLERFCSMSAWASCLPGQISEGNVVEKSLSSVPWVVGDTRCLLHGGCASRWAGWGAPSRNVVPVEWLRIGSFWAALLRNACWLTWQGFNKDFLYWSQLGFIDHELVTDVNKSSQNSKGQMEMSRSLVLQKDFHLKNTLQQQQWWLQSLDYRKWGVLYHPSGNLWPPRRST